MKYQTDPKLMFEAKSDCFVFTVLKVHEIIGKHEFSYRHLLGMRKVMVRADFIGKDGYINDKGISGISSVASGLTENHVYIKRVGSNDNYNFVIALYRRQLSPGKFVFHFVLMDPDNPALVLFDPWSKAGAKTTHEGQIIDYRFIFAEAV